MSTRFIPAFEKLTCTLSANLRTGSADLSANGASTAIVLSALYQNQSALIWTGWPSFIRLFRYCVVKVLTGLFTPSVVPRGSIESTV